jgi:hypothetical protein
VGHECIHFNLGLGFVEHEGGFLLPLEFAEAHPGAEILPGDVLLKPGFVDVETQPVRHVVREDHATPSRRTDIIPSVEVIRAFLKWLISSVMLVSLNTVAD